MKHACLSETDTLSRRRTDRESRVNRVQKACVAKKEDGARPLLFNDSAQANGHELEHVDVP